MSVDWVFPSSNGGTYDGFNDAGIETYTGARYDGLAREIIQNSLDAVVDDDESKVTVEFDLVKISRKDFPGADKLLETMKRCQEESKDDKARVFFENAIKELRKQEISCLKVSDCGTTGLRGNYRKREGEWHAITKGRGVSSDKSKTAGGSFGIGKNAPLTVSLLRTVFYSTFYKDGDKPVYRAQGKSILMSHAISDSEYTQATGFYGESDGCMPIEGNAPGDIPKILKPKEQGCVVFIPGFVVEHQWRKKIMATVVSNFFCAISQKKLEVLVQDEKRDIELIDQESLGKCLEEVRDSEIDSEKVQNSCNYYRSIQSEASPREAELTLLGHCKIWVLVEEGLPKRVALLRKTGMLITDDQVGLKRWTGRVDFAGVFMCDSEKGNSLLRDMENPQHNAFEPDRPTNPAQRSQCKKALKELVEWVRSSVDMLAKPEEAEVTQIDELSEFFPDINPAETIPGDEGERDIEGRPLYSPKPLKRHKPRVDTTEDDDDGEGGVGDEGGEGGNGDGNGPGEGDGSGGTGSRTFSKSVEIKNVRVVFATPEGKKQTVYFTPMKSGDIEISLAIMGDDGRPEKISIAEAKGLKGDAISVKAKKNVRVSLQVTLKNPVSDSIVVHAVEKSEKGSSDETTSK